MTIKEQILSNILNQIKILQGAYDFNKNLPDIIFEGVQLNGATPQEETLSRSIVSEFNTVVSKAIEGSTIQVKHATAANDYGKNKRLVVEILQEANKPLLKYQIVERFQKIEGGDEEDLVKVVTNALQSLQDDKKVIGYKPKQFKVRGFFWALSIWFENGELKEDYQLRGHQNLF